MLTYLLLCLIPLVEANNQPPLPWTYEPTIIPYAPGLTDSFVLAKDGKLSLDGLDWTFTTFNNPDIIKSTHFEIDDALSTMVGFGRPVTRVYTLGVASINVPPEQAFVTGWSSQNNDWEYNEEMFKMLDYVLDSARRWGVKICLPIINQDFGDQSSNYNGNWADLIGFYYGIDNYNDTKSIDFWTDDQMIQAYVLPSGVADESTKKLYAKVLDRVNTINGKKYGEDNAFWAIETGNELNYNMTTGADRTRPPPGNWTSTIAAHIKSLAPNLLVMDGSFSRNNFTDQKWAPEALSSPDVDIYSSHYYAPGDDPAYEFQAMGNDSDLVRSYGKTHVPLTCLGGSMLMRRFVIGEHGFYPWSYQWDEFYYLLGKTPGVAGAMAWGMRPHSSEGGFIVHSEGNGIFSYHMPGWSPPADPEFDANEYYVSRKTYQASYNIVGEAQPEYYPIPPAPTILSPNSTSNGSTISWLGAPWSEHYQIYWAAPDAKEWDQVANVIRDNVGPGLANWTLPALNGSYVMRGISVDLQGGAWSNVLTL